MEDKSGFKTWYAVSFAFQLGFLIIAPIAGFMLLGLWGDNGLRTSPWLLMTGIVVGTVVSAYEVYHLLTPLIKNTHD